MRTNNYSIARTLFLLILAAVMPSMAMADDDIYIVAGNNAEIFGTSWDGTNTANQMTWDAERNLYVKEYENAPKGNNYQLKVVENNTTWFGNSEGNNVMFNLTDPSYFEVTYDPANNEVKVDGPAVTFNSIFEYDKVFAVGNGSGNWLNGADWVPADLRNLMTEVSTGVWQIAYADVAPGDYKLKFAIDGSWDINFGGTYQENGVATYAMLGGPDISFTVEQTSTVTVTLDLTKYNHDTQAGATFTVDIDWPFSYTSVYATGNWLGDTTWDPALLAMTKVEDDVWEVEVTDIPEIPSEGYQTKFTVDGTWDLSFGGNYTASGTETAAEVNQSNNITLTAADMENVVAVKLRLDLSNYDYKKKQGATFTVTLTKKQTIILSDNALVAPITAYGDVFYQRNLVKGYNTIVLPFDVELSEITNVTGDSRTKAYAYGGSKVNETTNTVSVDFSEEVTTLSANKPYLLKTWKEATGNTLQFNNKQVAPVATPAINDSYYSFVGTYVALPEDNSTIVSGDYVCTAAGLKAASGGNKLNAFRAYLRSEAISVAPSAKMEVKVGADTIVVGEGDTTGISLDELLNNSTSDIYNLNGQKVSQPQKGVYIINGKKVVRK